MPEAPSTDNYTVPGGIKLFVNLGDGERDLGNIVEIDLEPGQDLLEHFTNRSGKRMKDKEIILEDKLTINFTMDEPNFENMRLFFRGGDTVLEGAGTANKVDQKLSLSGTSFISVGAYYGLTAVTVRQFLDYCLLYDNSIVGYVDNSIEADSLAGSPFELLAESTDFLYFGKLTKFQEMYIDLAVNGSYGALTWQYRKNDNTWATLTTAGAGDGLDTDGKVNWTIPVDWALYEVNGHTAYWIRVAAASVTTPATCNCVRQNGVANTDYVLDPGVASPSSRQDGRVSRIAAGFFGPEEEVKVSFTYVTWASQKMAIAAQAAIEGEVRLECFPSTGRGIQWEAYFGKASIKSKGAMKLDDKTWLPVPMSIEVLDNTNVDPTYPFGYFRNYEDAT